MGIVNCAAMAFYAAERKKELIPFATAWMKLESIMLSEISRLFDVKNNLTIAGGWWGTVERGDYRNYYKGHMDKTKGEGSGGGGGRWVQLGCGRGMGRKGIQL